MSTRETIGSKGSLDDLIQGDPFLPLAEHKADIVCMSALLTTTMPAMEAAVAGFEQRGDGIKTMVGGAPVTQTFADKIGADGYSEDAPSAVELARKLMAAIPPNRRVIVVGRRDMADAPWTTA